MEEEEEEENERLGTERMAFGGGWVGQKGQKGRKGSAWEGGERTNEQANRHKRIGKPPKRVKRPGPTELTIGQIPRTALQSSTYITHFLRIWWRAPKHDEFLEFLPFRIICLIHDHQSTRQCHWMSLEDSD